MDLWPKQDPGRTKARQGAPLAAAAATLQLRLLQAYAALPDAACFGAEHEALSRLCARAFRPAAAGQPGARCLRPHTPLHSWGLCALSLQEQPGHYVWDALPLCKRGIAEAVTEGACRTAILRSQSVGMPFCHFTYLVAIA